MKAARIICCKKFLWENYNMNDEQTILNPKTDWVFKLMFSKGEEGNKALISFLNAFLEDSYGKIKKAEIINTELIRDRPSGKTYRLDFLIRAEGLIPRRSAS